MTPSQNASREKPGVEPGFTAIPNRTAEGLSAWPHSLASLKLYIYLCRQSWGWRNKATKTCYCRKCIAQATIMHVSTVSKALTELENAELVEFRTDGRIDLDLKGPEAFRVKIPRCPEHTSLQHEQPGDVATRPRRRGESATNVWRNGHTKRLHSDVASLVTNAEKKLLKKEKEIRTSPAPPGALQVSQTQLTNRLETVEKMVGCVRSLHAPFSFASRTIRDGRSAIANPEVVRRSMPGRAVRAKSAHTLRTVEKAKTDRFVVAKSAPPRKDDSHNSKHNTVIASPRSLRAKQSVFRARPSSGSSTDSNLLDAHERQAPRFREVAVAWIRKCPHEPGRAGSVDSWTGRLIQIAERLNVSPHILIRCVPDGVACPRGYVRGFESGAYPLPAWTEDPAHKQTFFDWLDGAVAQSFSSCRSGAPLLLFGAPDNRLRRRKSQGPKEQAPDL